MFCAFYKFREQPFGASPDPRFLYLSRTHREAFSSLLYRIQMDSGFLAMIAEPGMGKTTLLFHLLRHLQPSARTAFIFQTQCSSQELLRYLLAEFECDTGSTDPVRISQELKAFLVAETNAGRRCILIVDEAQNLKPEVLETIRLLSNFETPRRKLLNIILSGQSELGDLLAGAGLQQFRQRLSRAIYLQRFTPAETALYIAHRLETAGYHEGVSQLFTSQALTGIAHLSDGIPRVINNICFNALSLGFAMERKEIDFAIVEEVAADLGLSSDLRADLCEELELSDSTPLDHASAGRPESESNGHLHSGNPDLNGTLAMVGNSSQADRVDVSDVPPRSFVSLSTIESLPKRASFEDDILASAEGASVPIDGEIAQPAPNVCCENQISAVPLRHGLRNSGKKSAGLFAASSLVGLLVLCVALAIDMPARHSVSAHPVANSGEIGRAATVAPSVPLRVPSVTGRTRTVLPSEASPRRPVIASRGQVDLSLATFVPEPLLNPLPLQSTPFATTSSLAAEAQSSDPVVHPAIGGTSAQGNDTPARPIWHPNPDYPAGAREKNAAGDVQLELSVSNSGSVYNVDVISGTPILAEAAERAARSWKYSPALSNGKPVNSQVYVVFHFRLD